MDFSHERYGVEDCGRWPTTSSTLPAVRAARAPAKLSMGFGVAGAPGANDTMNRLRHEKEKVNITIDYITSQGEKLILIAAAEAQAKSGHDAIHLSRRSSSDQFVAASAGYDLPPLKTWAEEERTRGTRCNFRRGIQTKPFRPLARQRRNGSPTRCTCRARRPR